MGLTPEEYERAKRDPEFFIKRAAERCASGEHTPMKAVLDNTVWCTVCGKYLGRTA